MAEKKTIRIFCPTHEAAFETAEGPKILCEITGHALSVGFPSSEVWEFCCNCETFAPSQLDKGEKARSNCFSCQNEISTRFACAACQTFSFECDSQAKGRTYFVNKRGIEPCCPACQITDQATALVRHDCKEIDVKFLTARENCPFCLEKTKPVREPARILQPDKDFCPRCDAQIELGAVFCGKCKFQLRSDVVPEKIGTDAMRTQLLGSLCPTCSTPVPSESTYCGECGQAIFRPIPSLVPPPPPPPPKSAGFAPSAGTTPNEFTLPITSGVTKSPGRLFGALGIGFVALLIVIGIISSSIKSTETATNVNANRLSVSNNANYGTSNVGNSRPTEIFPSSFEREYEGTIGRRQLSMTLSRTGSNLTGRASTGKQWDALSGTIGPYGAFDVEATPFDDGAPTGRFSGTILNDGTINGAWTKLDGTSSTSFKVSQK